VGAPGTPPRPVTEGSELPAGGAPARACAICAGCALEADTIPTHFAHPTHIVLP
jgi:hypothetical protein